jgi:hypothetical protein
MTNMISIALADYSEAVRLDTGYANAFNNRGIAWQAEGELDRAIVLVQRGSIY